MGEAYTVFWARERCVALRRLGGLGLPLDTLYGGPHSSQPSFRRATVQVGDDVYPIFVQAGTMYVIGRARVRQILDLDEYVAARGDLFAPYLAEPPAWAYREDISLTPRFVQALEAFERMREAIPAMRYLAPGCTSEAVELENGSPTRLDLAISPAMLASVRYRSRRAERDLSKYIRDGRLTSILGVQGIYRLSEDTQRAFETLGTDANYALATAATSALQ